MTAAERDPLSTLKARLEARRAEVEGTIRGGAEKSGRCSGVAEARRLEVLRARASACVEYELGALEGDGDQSEEMVPEVVLAEARAAARAGVGHGTILAGHCTGNLHFADLLIEEARRVGLPRAELERVFGALTRRFGRLLSAVSVAYVREELAPLYAVLEGRG